MSSTSRVAVVTGASSGLGEALARELSQQGWSVGLIARRGERITALADELRRPGRSVTAVAADVGDRPSLVTAVGAIRAELGAIDLLLANAGIGKPDFLNPLTVSDIEEMHRVNFLGVIYAIDAVLPEMFSRGAGRIAAVSSMGAYHGMPGSGGYCASKAAVNTFMNALRIQLRGTGITTTTICPGFVRTPMTDVNTFKMPWLMEPADAARLVVRAIQRGDKVYNFPWQLACLMNLLKRLPDWVIASTLPRKTDGRAT